MTASNLGVINKPDEKELSDYLQNRSIKDIIELTNRVTNKKMNATLSSLLPSNSSDGLDPGEIFDKGIGVCRHMVPVFSAVGQYLFNLGNVDNVYFDSAYDDNHVWIEIYALECDKIIATSVDPTRSNEAGVLNAYNSGHYDKDDNFVAWKLIRCENYQGAKSELERIIQNNPDTESEAKALFSLAYMHFNSRWPTYDPQKSIDLHSEFLDKFSDYRPWMSSYANDRIRHAEEEIAR